jgi:cytochrome P450
MDDLVTEKDERYDTLFDAEHDAKVFGMRLLPDPYPKWQELLAKAPVHSGTLPELMGYEPEVAGHFYHPGPAYVTALSFDAVSEGFTNSDRFSSEFYVDGGIEQQTGDTVLSMDGLRHRAYRDVVQPFFQPPYAAGWWAENVISSLIDQLVGAMEKKGGADLNADFFARLPMHVVTAGFGLSSEEGLAFRFHFQAGVTPSRTQAERLESAQKAIDILTRVTEERQQNPKDDLISKVAHAIIKLPDGTTRKLTTKEVVDFCRITMGAGGGTTWRQLGITLFALLSNPDQFEDLKADRNLMNNTILESARWCATDPIFPRKAMKDTVLQGFPVAKGTVLHLCLGAANRDPSRWENPDKFDIHRPVKRSLAFAAGAHSCLGQHVARQEMSLAMNAIMDRLPNIRWDPTKPKPELQGGLIGRGPGPLHVVFG